MTVIGADPEALDALTAELRQAARRLDGIVAGLGSGLTRSGWAGRDADRFEREWRLHLRPRLRESARDCSTLATRLTAQSADQRRASAPTGGGRARAAGAVGGLGPLPTRTETWSGHLQAGHGFLSASAAGSLVLEHLGSGRVQVTATNGAGAGLSASAGGGGSATVGDWSGSAGTAAGAIAQVDGVERRRWTVAADAVPSLVAGLALEGTVVGLPFRVLDGAAEGVGEVLSVLGVDNDLGRTATFPLVPEPDRVEHLAGVAVGASYLSGAAGTTGAPTGSASVSGRLAVGTAIDGHDRESLVLEESATGATALSSGLASALGVHLGPAATARGELATRIEVPVGGRPGDDRPVLVTFRATGDGDEVLTRVAVDPAAAGPAADVLRAAVRDVAGGDPAGAVRRLARSVIPVDAVSVRVSTATVERDTLGLSLSGTAGSLGPEGTHTTVTPDR